MLNINTKPCYLTGLAMMVFSLPLLPWLRGAPAQREIGVASREKSSDLTIAAVVFAIPNALVWLVILFQYYGGSFDGLISDVVSGAFTKAHYQIGNSLGGGRDSTIFMPFRDIVSLKHMIGILQLLVIYSPFVCVLLTAALVSEPRNSVQKLIRSADGRFFLSLLLPYLVYIATWEPKLGLARDWDLFSHVTLFALFVVFHLIMTEQVWRRSRMVLLGLGVFTSLLMTSNLVQKTHDPLTPTGVEDALNWLALP